MAAERKWPCSVEVSRCRYPVALGAARRERELAATLRAALSRARESTGEGWAPCILEPRLNEFAMKRALCVHPQFAHYLKASSVTRYCLSQGRAQLGGSG